MRFERTFCDVLLTNFIVGLCRLLPELAELGAEDPAVVVADAGFKIKKGLPGEQKFVRITLM